MSDLQSRFERISALAERETACIVEKDTEGLADVAARRERAIQEFLAVGHQGQEDAFREKLVRMQITNTRLRNEAKLLHQTLKEELLKLRSETKRMGGYRGGAIITPLVPRLLSRRG